MTDYISAIAGRKTLDVQKIQGILDKSLSEKDVRCRKSLRLLMTLGLERDEILKMLAHHKSRVKYGYCLSPISLAHILSLAQENEASLLTLVESPFFLLKTCWLYEHAPYFFFFGKRSTEDLDTYIIKFASQYDNLFLKNNVSIDTWVKISNPRRVMTVTFWENKIFDPVSLVEKVKDERLEGLELSIDFHPFNYTKLLPEEVTEEKREQIKEASRKSGIKIDIHGPIVGPYAPSPDPSIGKQLFFDPLDCFEIQCETIDLAKDIGAGSVVIHLIDPSNLKKMVQLILKAGGSDVRVTLENYCQTEKRQNADIFIACINDILGALPQEVRKKNFGITLDVGHLNIEGEDPIVACDKIGRYCLENRVYLRLHATDNYGNLLFSPPAYSADVHSRVSGRGINNAIIIKLLRSMGHQLDVVAEQIQPLMPEDTALIHEANSFPIDDSYELIIRKGKKKLSAVTSESLIDHEVLKEKAYLFLAGMEGASHLREHLVYRKIQDKKYLSVDEAKKISKSFMKMPHKFKNDLVEYVDDLLLPIQSESGAIQKGEIDLICQNISGALFGTINNEHLNEIFSETRVYHEADVVCEQNTIGQAMYYIKKGEVTVFLNKTPMASLGPGEIFGEISLFYNVKRTATIEAARDNTKVGILTRMGLENLLKSSKPYSHDLIYRLYNTLPDRLRNLNDKYKTAINALYLILDADKKNLLEIDGLQTEIRLESDLFPALTREEAKGLFQEIKVFDANQVIFSEGDPAEGAYFILKGRVKAVTFSRNDKEIILGELGREEIFGEMALVDDKPRSASIVTVTPSKLGFVARETYNAFLETRSELAFQLMSFICLSLFRRILRLDRLYAKIKEAFN